MADQDAMAIIDVINLYGLAMDTQRWDLLDRIFNSDVEADFGERHHPQTARLKYAAAKTLVHHPVIPVKDIWLYPLRKNFSAVLCN